GPGPEPGSAGPRRPRRGRSRARRRTGGEGCRAPLAAGSPTVSCFRVYRRSGATRKCRDEGGPPSPPRGRRGLRRVSGGDDGRREVAGASADAVVAHRCLHRPAVRPGRVPAHGRLASDLRAPAVLPAPVVFCPACRRGRQPGYRVGGRGAGEGLPPETL